MSRILLMHPGAMGESVGRALLAAGHEVFWCSAGRSAATRARAAEAGLSEVGTLEGAVREVAYAMSVCPPEFAVGVATELADAGFEGVFVDANAIAPDTMRRVEEAAGTTVVDGGIVGPPARQSGSTRLYLSGERADEVAALFAGTVMDAREVDGPVGAASALKMAFAAWTKGTSALLLAVRALAESEGVTGALMDEWRISLPDLEVRSEGTARATSGKAWRFEAEMREIAATFAAAGLPDGFHEAAAQVYGRMRGFKGEEPASLGEVLVALSTQRD